MDESAAPPLHPAEPAGPAPITGEGRSRRSRLLWEVDRWAGQPVTALIVLAAAAAWILLSVTFDFPGRWEQIFQVLVAGITVTMVFVIQHTQARHQAATQRKLDEILRALPDADNSLLTLEHASDSELRATRRQHRQLRKAALDQSGDGDHELMPAQAQGLAATRKSLSSLMPAALAPGVDVLVADLTGTTVPGVSDCAGP